MPSRLLLAYYTAAGADAAGGSECNDDADDDVHRSSLFTRSFPDIGLINRLIALLMNRISRIVPLPSVQGQQLHRCHQQPVDGHTCPANYYIASAPERNGCETKRIASFREIR